MTTMRDQSSILPLRVSGLGFEAGGKPLVSDLSFNIGVRNEYDSYIPPSAETSNDFKLYAGIKLAF